MSTFKEQLQEVRNRIWDLLGVKPTHSSLFIKSLEGNVLTFNYHLPFSKEEEFIGNFIKQNPEIRLFQVERIQFPNNLNSSLSRKLYNGITLGWAPEKELYEKNKIPNSDYIYDAINQKTYPPFHKWDSLPEITQIYLVNACPVGIDKIKSPSEAVQMAAIKNEPSCITLIDSPTENAILTAVQKNRSVLESIKNLSEEIQVQIAKLIPTAIRYIDNPNEEVQLIAIERNPYAIDGLANPTENAQLTAVMKDYNVLSRINNPTPQVCKTAIEQLYNNKVTINISSLPSIDSFCEDSQFLVDDISNFPAQKQSLLSDFENKYSNKRSNDVDISPVSDKEIIGEISYYGFNGEIVETMVFHNVDRYLNCIEEELDVNPTGFKCKTLTKDPKTLKAVDDLYYNLVGESNPNTIDSYYSVTQDKLYNPQNSLETISKTYQKLGYTTIAEAINEHLPAYEKLCEIGTTSYKIKHIEICSTKSKKLYADIFLGYQEQIPSLSFKNLRIQDLITGKTHLANAIRDYCYKKDFSIFDLPRAEVENLLSGAKLSIPGKSTNLSMRLNKTALGYGLKTCQQLFSMMDSSAEI